MTRPGMASIAAAALLLLVSAVHGFVSLPFTSTGCHDPFGTLSTTILPSTALRLTAIQEGEILVHESVVEGRMLKLNAALRSFNSSQASHLLQELSSIDGDSTDPEAVDIVLDELMTFHSNNLPLWTCIGWLTRFSSRARLASLHRAIAWITPPPPPPASSSSSSIDSNNNEQETEASLGLQTRKRRALLSILRTLAQPAVSNGFVSDRPVAIRQIEMRTRRERNRPQRLSTADMIARRPEGLETPNYTVVAQRRGYEIRQYEPYSVCTVSMGMNRTANPKFDAAVREPPKGNVKAFGALAGYLFGKNKANAAMKMTTPVLTTEDEQMSFVLPSDYWKDASTAPQPLDDSGVQVRTVQGGERAVILFGGYALNVDKIKRELLGYVRNDSTYNVVPGERPVLAQYNDPFTLPWKRLNEVSVAVRAKQ